MSEYPREIERLQRLLAKERREKEEAEARENEAKARENEAKARENEAKARENEAKAREEKERREKEEEQRKNQKTTLEEYLHNCHFHLYKNLALADKSKSTTGLATRVDGKYYPKWLRPWNSFTNSEQRQHFRDIQRACGNKRLFDQESTTRDLGRAISRNQAGNENAIDHFEKLAVEDPTWDILAAVRDEEGLRTEYQFMGLRFTSNIRDFTQPSDGSQLGDMDQGLTGTSIRTTSEPGINKPSLKPDGYGIHTHLDGAECLAFVYDYKAAHKFAAGYLKAALANDKLFMDVIGWANSDKYKSDAKLQEQEREETRIAMALTQVFHYMVSCGVTYGYVAAGNSLVFLNIDRANLQTLYCHLCVPDEEVGEASAGDWASHVSRTAVAQLASFCLLSLRSEGLKGYALDEALQKAKKELAVWPTPYENAAQVLRADKTDSSSPTSSRGTDDSDFISNAGPATRKYLLRPRSSCRDPAVLRRDRDDDEEDSLGGDRSRTWTRTTEKSRKQGPSSGSCRDDDAETCDSAPARQYCTQACLLGLKRGLDLDSNCPNVLSHRTAQGDARHHIDAGEFTCLVGERLRQNPYRYCEALDRWGKVGATGLLFKLELAPYGYTFVAKGTLSAYRRRLEHESCVYARLDSLQGKVVPVHLGVVQLSRGYVLPGGARVVHMMLMSWGGEKVPDIRTPDLTAEVRRSSQAVWAEGVDHGDERGPNLLWNDERRCVMVIDFDRATLFRAPKHKQLVELSGDKRKRHRDFGKYSRKRGFRQGCLQIVE